MNIKKYKNKISINGIEREFTNDIETVLEFSNCCIILLMNDDIPDNNVIAVGYDGNILWNISEIVKFSYPEAYIMISKESERTFSATTYNGIRFVIDILSRKITNKEITK
jgi:hypothetical protein